MDGTRKSPISRKLIDRIVELKKFKSDRSQHLILIENSPLNQTKSLTLTTLLSCLQTIIRKKILCKILSLNQLLINTQKLLFNMIKMPLMMLNIWKTILLNH